MGIYFMPKQRYKCSKCGSENCNEYSDPPAHPYAGHNEGVVCNNCGHKTSHYVKSFMELETGSGQTYSYNPNKPREF